MGYDRTRQAAPGAMWVEASMDNRSKPRTSVPSGETDDGNCWFALVVSRSAAPVPSAAWLYRFKMPARSDVKMIRRPSGVHLASESEPGATVKRLSVSRSKSQIQMSLLC